MIEYVTTGVELFARNAVTTAGLVRGADCLASFMHSGQWNPTAAGVWQSAQIVRPQRWQSTKLCRFGWR